MEQAVPGLHCLWSKLSWDCTVCGAGCPVSALFAQDYLSKYLEPLRYLQTEFANHTVSQ